MNNVLVFMRAILSTFIFMQAANMYSGGVTAHGLIYGIHNDQMQKLQRDELLEAETRKNKLLLELHQLDVEIAELKKDRIELEQEIVIYDALTIKNKKDEDLITVCDRLEKKIQEYNNAYKKMVVDHSNVHKVTESLIDACIAQEARRVLLADIKKNAESFQDTTHSVDVNFLATAALQRDANKIKGAVKFTSEQDIQYAREFLMQHKTEADVAFFDQSLRDGYYEKRSFISRYVDVIVLSISGLVGGIWLGKHITN